MRESVIYLFKCVYSNTCMSIDPDQIDEGIP